MAIYRTHRRKAKWIVPFLVILLVAGCAGIEPYEPRNDREEGPQKGLFTGAEGEWVIFRKADEPEADSESGKTADEPTDGEEKKDQDQKR
jgi:hypothetical protein